MMPQCYVDLAFEPPAAYVRLDSVMAILDEPSIPEDPEAGDPGRPRGVTILLDSGYELFLPLQMRAAVLSILNDGMELLRRNMHGGA